MNTDRCNNRRAWLLFFAFLLITVLYSLNMQRLGFYGDSELHFIPAPEYVERLSGTHKNVIALGFFLKGVLELAGDVSGKTDVLLELFSVAIKLDPKFNKAIFLGGVVAPTFGADMEKAIGFLEKAAQQRPDEWRIPYWIGFNYQETGSFGKAGEFYLKAAELPGAPAFMKFSAIDPLSRGKSIEKAILATTNLLATVEDDDAEWIVMRLEWLKQIQALEMKAREFKQQFGKFPQSIEEMVEKELLDKSPEDKFGNGFYMADPDDPDYGYRILSE